MSSNPVNFALLIDLAKETSSEKRRELLRQVTDLFLADADSRSDSECGLFDEIVGAVTYDLKVEVRAELARKVADSTAPLRRTARRLALDEIEVARPVIERSKALTTEDILDVIAHKSQDHMMAVTKRDHIPHEVSSALVERGEDPVVASLLENRNAEISRPTFERIADRAADSEALHAPFVKRQNVPLDLLNDMYTRVESELRRDILRHFEKVSADDLNAALELSKQRVAAAYGAVPKDYELANKRIAEMERKGALKPPALVQLLRENQRTAFLLAFARLTDVDFSVVQRLVDGQDLDSLAILSRASGFDRALFVTLCILIAGQESGMAKADIFGRIYEQVPVAAAQRAIRFWRVRAKTSGEAAA